MGDHNGADGQHVIHTHTYIFIYLFIYHLLYSINSSLCTDTTGCGTCQSSIHYIVKHNYYILHIDINTYNVSGSGKYH